MCSRLRRRPSWARRTSVTSSRTSAVTSTACTRYRPGSTSRSGARSPRDEALAGARRRGPARSAATPTTRTSVSPTRGTPSASRGSSPATSRRSCYFGKLLRNKGVHVLLEALEGVDARAVVVGFGDYREELEEMAPEGVLFTGPLEHRHLVHLLALADACVVPSIFPEAFGMVAAEAAAAGCPPLVARHSGLAEVADGLEAEYPRRAARSHLLHLGRRGRPAREASPGCSRCRPMNATAIREAGPPCRGRALELGECRRPAPRARSLTKTSTTVVRRNG